MATSSIWVDSEIVQSKEDDFCLYSVDESIIMRDDLPAIKPGEILLVVDNIIPTLRKYLEKYPLNKNGLLVYTKDKKEEQKR